MEKDMIMMQEVCHTLSTDLLQQRQRTEKAEYDSTVQKMAIQIVVSTLSQQQPHAMKQTTLPAPDPGPVSVSKHVPNTNTTTTTTTTTNNNNNNNTMEFG